MLPCLDPVIVFHINRYHRIDVMIKWLENLVHSGCTLGQDTQSENTCNFPFCSSPNSAQFFSTGTITRCKNCHSTTRDPTFWFIDLPQGLRNTSYRKDNREFHFLSFVVPHHRCLGSPHLPETSPLHVSCPAQQLLGSPLLSQGLSTRKDLSSVHVAKTQKGAVFSHFGFLKIAEGHHSS